MNLIIVKKRRFEKVVYLSLIHEPNLYIYTRLLGRFAPPFTFFAMKVAISNRFKFASTISGSIGSPVFSFIGYKQTNTQTDKINLYIDILCTVTD